jgi:hypothetical protein
LATLLIGNGINNLSLPSLSWQDLLGDLIVSINKENVINLEKKPFLHVYEEIYTRALKYTESNENILKNKIVDSTKRIARNNYHDVILDLRFENILTTNYDYNLSPDVSGSKTKETKYSLYRYQEYKDKKIWHIHGELNNPESIMIGYEHYMGSIHNIQTNQNKKKDEKKKESWVDIFLRDDVYILGLGLDFGEIDLWWLLSYRNRLILEDKIPANKIVYIKSKKIETFNNEIIECEKRVENNIKEKEEKAKIEMLQVFGVEIKEFNLADRNYSLFYDEVITFLRNKLV